MSRKECDKERDNVCSTGLHFCSLEYLPNFGSSSNGERTVIVKVNPKDVTSIPSDYNMSKGRCCEYEVVGEHVGDDHTSAFKDPVHDRKGGIINRPRDKQGRFITWTEFRPRNKKGRFIKKD